jgi:pimeloyl-ACP methyl ester carboxylesterase
MVLVPGVARQGTDDPRLVAFANTLARARFEVLVPDLGGLRDLKVGAQDIHAIADACLYLARLDDGRRPLGVTAISYAAGPAVAALFEPGVEEGVDFALAIGGYHDLEAVLTFFTTGYHREALGPWRHRRPNAYGKWMFVRSNAGRLESRRDRVLLSAMAGRKLDDLSADVSDLAADLGQEGRAVWALLENRDPDRVPALIAALSPGVVEDIRRLDLKRRDLARLGVRFILVHGHDDPIIPVTESIGLAAALAPGRAELFILDSLDHVDPKPTGLADKIRLLRAIYTVLEIRDGVGKP